MHMKSVGNTLVVNTFLGTLVVNTFLGTADRCLVVPIEVFTSYKHILLLSALGVLIKITCPWITVVVLILIKEGHTLLDSG